MNIVFPKNYLFQNDNSYVVDFEKETVLKNVITQLMIQIGGRQSLESHCVFPFPGSPYVGSYTLKVASESADNAKVEMNPSLKVTIQATTVNGLANFLLTGKPVQTDVTINYPEKFLFKRGAMEGYEDDNMIRDLISGMTLQPEVSNHLSKCIAIKQFTPLTLQSSNRYSYPFSNKLGRFSLRLEIPEYPIPTGTVTVVSKDKFIAVASAETDKRMPLTLTLTGEE